MRILISTAHYLIVLTAILLPFILDWKVFVLIVLAYHLIITCGIGYCPFTLWQYGSVKTGFIEKHLKFLLKALKLKIPQSQLQTFIRYGIPVLLITVSVAYQIVIK